MNERDRGKIYAVGLWPRKRLPAKYAFDLKAKFWAHFGRWAVDMCIHFVEKGDTSAPI